MIDFLVHSLDNMAESPHTF